MIQQFSLHYFIVVFERRKACDGNRSLIKSVFGASIEDKAVDQRWGLSFKNY